MIHNRSLVSIAIMVATMMLVVFSNKTQAQTCPCNYMVCAVCVQSTLPGIKAATTGAFKSLSALQKTMDSTIELGVKAEVQTINNYKNNIVAAIQADAMNTSHTIELGRESQQRLLEGLRTSIESTQQSGIVARSNLKVVENYGHENVSYSAKKRSNSQYAKIISASAFDEFKVEDEYFADLGVMTQIVNSRKVKFIDKIMVPETNDDHHFQMINIINGLESNDYKSDVLNEDMWDEAFAFRRFIASPLDVQSGVSTFDLKAQDEKSIAVIKARAKAASEFMAWEMAIRSSIVTDSGTTSLFHNLKESVIDIYQSEEGMIDNVQSGEREILNEIATNEAIGAVLDMLLLETSAYQLRLEGAKLGGLNDEKYSSDYGYQKIDKTNSTINRGH